MHKNLFAERRALNKTQQDVAKALGISKETYARKERGSHQFDLDEASKISKYLGVSLDKLFPEFFLAK